MNIFQTILQFFTGKLAENATALDVSEKLAEMNGKTLPDMLKEASESAVSKIQESVSALTTSFDELKGKFTALESVNAGLLTENASLKAIEASKIQLEAQIAELKTAHESALILKSKELEKLNIQLTEAQANQRTTPPTPPIRTEKANALSDWED